MYVPNRGDYIQAFDADTGAVRWEYRRPVPGRCAGQHEP